MLETLEVQISISSLRYPRPPEYQGGTVRKFILRRYCNVPITHPVCFALQNQIQTCLQNTETHSQRGRQNILNGLLQKLFPRCRLSLQAELASYLQERLPGCGAIVANQVHLGTPNAGKGDWLLLAKFLSILYRTPFETPSLKTFHLYFLGHSPHNGLRLATTD